MKRGSWQRILVNGILILVFILSVIKSDVHAQNPAPPAQGCTPGTDYTTCAFYVIANEDDAGKAAYECNYLLYWNELYLEKCYYTGESVKNGILFQRVIIPVPSGQEILASYIEFTTDGPYTSSTIVTNIRGEAAISPYSFTGNHNFDIIDRQKVLPFITWTIDGGTPFSMNDRWELGDIRRTPDVTDILNAITGQAGWQNGTHSATFFFENLSASPGNTHRKVLAHDRPPGPYQELPP